MPPVTGPTDRRDQFRALFDPKGVVVAGASSHPGKFGFVALHNILAAGYGGPVHATNREGVEVLGLRTLRDLEELPEGAADLVFVCTPAPGNPELLRVAAKKGITAAFIASAGAAPRRSWPRWPTTWASSSSAPTARAWCPPRRGCAPRSWPPTRRRGASGS
jgi:predicted CoA-binding protein